SLGSACREGGVSWSKTHHPASSRRRASRRTPGSRTAPTNPDGAPASAGATPVLRGNGPPPAYSFPSSRQVHRVARVQRRTGAEQPGPPVPAHRTCPRPARAATRDRAIVTVAEGARVQDVPISPTDTGKVPWNTIA